MTTIVNNPAPVQEQSGGAVTVLIVAMVFVGLAALFYFYGMPAIRRMGTTQINVPATQVIIPEKIDVNVSQTK